MDCYREAHEIFKANSQHINPYEPIRNRIRIECHRLSRLTNNRDIHYFLVGHLAGYLGYTDMARASFGKALAMSDRKDISTHAKDMLAILAKDESQEDVSYVTLMAPDFGSNNEFAIGASIASNVGVAAGANYAIFTQCVNDRPEIRRLIDQVASSGLILILLGHSAGVGFRMLFETDHDVLDRDDILYMSEIRSRFHILDFSCSKGYYKNILNGAREGDGLVTSKTGYVGPREAEKFTFGFMQMFKHTGDFKKAVLAGKNSVKLLSGHDSNLEMYSL